MLGGVSREGQVCSGNNCRFCHTNVAIGATVIEQIAVALLHHAFYENYICHLSDFLPVFFWIEYWFLAAPQQLPWIGAVENRNPGAIHETVVGAVVNQHHPLGGDNRRRARLGDSRIESAWPDGKHWQLSSF